MQWFRGALKRTLYLCVVLLLSAQLTQSFAQTAFPPNYQFNESSLLQAFQRLGSAEETQIGSPLNGSDEYAGHDKFEGLKSFSEPVDDYTCPKGNCESTGSTAPIPDLDGDLTATSSNYVEGGKKSYPIAAMLPPAMGAMSDNLWSPTMTRILNDQLSAATIVQLAAMTSTEPSVAEAASIATRNALSLHQASLLTGIHASNLGQEMPATREFVTVYAECMQSYFGKAGLSFAEALARCLRDAGLPSPYTLVRGQITGLPTENMNFNHTAAYQAANPLALPADANASAPEVSPQRVGRLTDLLFNEHAFTNIIPTTTPTHTNVNRAKQDFRKFIGDIRWAVSFDNPSNPGVPTNRLTAKTDVIEPTWLAKDHLQLRTHERWDLMRTVLWAYCDWLKEHHTDPTANTGAVADIPSTVWADLYDVTGTYQIPAFTLRFLSTPGYTITPQEFDPLFSEIEKEPLINQNCDYYFGDSRTVLPYCPFVTSAAGACVAPTASESFGLARRPYYGYTSATGGRPTPIQEYINTRVSPTFGKKVPRLFRRMYFMARTLSRIEILQEALVSLNLLRNLNADDVVGSGGSLLADAQKLIYRAAQSTDIERSLSETTTALQKYLDNAKLEIEREGASAVQAAGQLPQ